MPTSSRTRLLVRPTAEGHGVTTLELFFDLVFVFAITQVTAFMAADLEWRGLLRGLMLLILLWWAWCSYAWLGNQARADEGIVRASLLGAMGGMFVVAVAIPEAWNDSTGGLPSPLVLATALSFVRFAHLGIYAIAAAGDSGLRRQIARTAIPVVLAAALLITGGLAGGTAQTALWVLALVVDTFGVYFSGNDWRLPSAKHFAERHGLIVLIALGESIVAIGVGVGDLPISVPIVLAALLGLTVCVTLWWAYFDVVAPVAERVLEGSSGVDRARLAKDSFTYLHFPMVAGIVYLALGLKKVMAYVADTSHHALSDPLAATPLWALYGGAAVYLLAHLAFRKRNIGSINRPRLLLALVLLLAPFGVGSLPALAALAVLAALLVGLIAFEVLRYADARDAIRHAQQT